MAIVLDDILNPEFTTNSMRWIPVSVKVARVDFSGGIPTKFAGALTTSACFIYFSVSLYQEFFLRNRLREYIPA